MSTPNLHRALCLTAWIAGGFCLLVCAVMVAKHLTAATNDPWKSPQLLALKDNLAAASWTLTDEEMTRLDAASSAPRPYPYGVQKTVFAERNP